ncbi:MAG: hypothetical protein AAB256_05340, partial [Deltaproteobacteria bacterium]
KTYTNLHNLGIFANVEIIKYNFDQPFDNMKEAVAFMTNLNLTSLLWFPEFNKEVQHLGKDVCHGQVEMG